MVTTQQNQALLLFRVGPVYCCAPSAPVEAMIEPRPLTRTPGSRPGQPGLFRHAGHIVNTSDLRYRFGVAEADQAMPGRVIITRLASGRIGFHVDEIIEVLEMPDSGWGALPPLLPRGVFTRTLLWRTRICLYADFEHLHTLTGSGYLQRYLEQLQTQSSANNSATSHHSKPTAPTTRSTPPDSEPTVPLPTRSAIDTHRVHQQTGAPVQPQPARHTAPTVRRPIQHTAIRQAHTRTTRLPSTPPRTDKQLGNESQPAAVKHATHTAASLVTRTKSFTTQHADQALQTPQRATLSEPRTVTQQTTIGSGSVLALLMGFLIVLGGIGYGTWWLFASGEHVSGRPAINPSLSSPSSQGAQQARESADTRLTPVTSDEHVPEVTESLARPETTSIIPTPVSTPSATAKQHSRQTTQTDETLHARIERDAQGITITLEVAEDDPVFRPASTSQVAPAGTAPESKPAHTDAIAPASASPAPIAEDSQIQGDSIEIMHIVVPGDTLWHIAQRYVNNPYRYPELARLSNIHNPDLIYPGDRVRILKRKRRKTDETVRE